jgi:hypothetical protein
MHVKLIGHSRGPLVVYQPLHACTYMLHDGNIISTDGFDIEKKRGSRGAHDEALSARVLSME